MESVLSLNWYSSAVDTLTTPDNYGRPYLQQTYEGPGVKSGIRWSMRMTYLAVCNTFPSLRRFTSWCGLAWRAFTEYLYDTLGRNTKITDGYGLEVDYVV